MTKVVITSPVEHDGKALAVTGKPVDLPAELAESLVKAGAAELSGKAKAQAAEQVAEDVPADAGVEPTPEV